MIQTNQKQILTNVDEKTIIQMKFVRNILKTLVRIICRHVFFEKIDVRFESFIRSFQRLIDRTLLL